MCSRLACELQQLVKKYQQAGEQLTAVGKQLRQARSSLKTMETQLEGPPLHVHHSRVAQVRRCLLAACRCTLACRIMFS